MVAVAGPLTRRDESPHTSQVCGSGTNTRGLTWKSQTSPRWGALSGTVGAAVRALVPDLESGHGQRRSAL